MYVKIVRLYRQIMNYLAFRYEPTEYLICYIDTREFDRVKLKLHKERFFFNDFSYRMIEELYNVRKLIDRDYQVHLRIYSDGRVTGHYETRTEHPSDHLKGIGYRLLTNSEKDEISEMFKSMGVLRC